MPELSRFYGIVIQMYPREHGRSHFHARYSGATAIIGIANLSMCMKAISHAEP